MSLFHFLLLPALSGVDFIDLLRVAFALAEPKNVEKTVKLSEFLRFRDLRVQKLRVNIVVKSTPDLNDPSD